MEIQETTGSKAVKEFVKDLNKQLEDKLYLADEEKRKANVLQFDRTVGYANGIAAAIDIVNQMAKKGEQ